MVEWVGLPRPRAVTKEDARAAPLRGTEEKRRAGTTPHAEPRRKVWVVMVLSFFLFTIYFQIFRESCIDAPPRGTAQLSDSWEDLHHVNADSM